MGPAGFLGGGLLEVGLQSEKKRGQYWRVPSPPLPFFCFCFFFFPSRRPRWQEDIGRTGRSKPRREASEREEGGKGGKEGRDGRERSEAITHDEVVPVLGLLEAAVGGTRGR